MEHRHAHRIACHFNIELYHDNDFLGMAHVENISKNGLCIRTKLSLSNNEMVYIKFPPKAEQHGWPDIVRGIVLHADNDSIGLLFNNSIFTNLNNLQKACDDISS